MRTRSSRPRPESILVYLLFLSLLVFDSMSLHYARSRTIAKNTTTDSKSVASERNRSKDLAARPHEETQLREKVKQVIEDLAHEKGWTLGEDSPLKPIIAEKNNNGSMLRAIEKNLYIATARDITLEELSDYVEILRNSPGLINLGVDIIETGWVRIGDEPIMQVGIGRYEPRMIMGNIRFIVRKREESTTTTGWRLIPRQLRAYGSVCLHTGNMFPSIKTDILKKKPLSFIQRPGIETPMPPTQKPKQPKKPRIAIIIDDIGHVRQPTEDFFAIRSPLTFAVLPGEKFSISHAGEAINRGYEVILHLPLEPLDESVDPGLGLIRRSMTPRQVLRQLKINLDSIPGVIGVNNHMGSKGTQDAILMDLIMKDLKARGLFFVDSRTVAHSIAWKVAVDNEVPSTVRDVFIDHYGIKGIEKQMKILLNKALENGSAVGIAHARPGVAQAIADFLPQITQAGVEIVPVSALVK